MNFICDRTALAEAVNTVQKAVTVRSTLNVLEGILIKTGEGKITLTGNDLEICIESVIEAQVRESGSVVLNAKLFGEIIRKVNGETVEINVNQNNVTKIKCGSSTFDINGISPEEFPEIPRFETEFEINLTQKELRSLVSHTIFAVGTSESKLILTGCLLEAEGNCVTMVAVDGFRLAIKKITSDGEKITGRLGGASVVIPSKSLNELTKILKDSDDKMTIRCSGKNARFEFDNVVFTSRLLEGEFIDYKKIIPTEFKTEITVDVRSILGSVERASLIITSEVTKSPVILNIDNGELKINCETAAGKVEEFVPVDMVGGGIEIGFNNRYLLEALKAADSENVKVSFIGSINPCLIAPAEGDGFQYIVLPVRLKNEN